MINIEVDRSPSSVLTGVPVFVSTLTVTGRYPGNYSYAVRNFFSPNSYKVATYEIMGMQLTILYMCLGGIQFRNNPRCVGRNTVLRTYILKSMRGNKLENPATPP